MSAAPSRRALAAGLAFMLAALCFGGCGAARYGKQDLNIAVLNYHQHLRWGRLGPASKLVAPGLREAFLKEWTAREKSIQLQDIEVMDMVEEQDGDVMVLTIKIAWIETRTQRLRSDLIHERWLRTENGWVLEKLPDMPI